MTNGDVLEIEYTLPTNTSTLWQRRWNFSVCFFLVCLVSETVRKESLEIMNDHRTHRTHRTGDENDA